MQMDISICLLLLWLWSSVSQLLNLQACFPCKDDDKSVKLPKLRLEIYTLLAFVGNTF